MPNRYEREIEEILRNLEQPGPKGGLGQKFGERLRRKPNPHVNTRQRRFFSLRFRASEWILITAVVAALVSGGFAYAQEGGPNVFTGALAIVGLVCLTLIALSQFLFRPRQSTQSTRSGTVTPLRRNPLSSIATRWNLFLLKLRYRRRNNR